MARQKHTPRVYVDAPLAVGERLELPEAKRHHLATVLRLSADDDLTLFNGDGGEYAARVLEATRKRLVVAVETRHTPTRESALDLTLVQAVARGDRMDFALAKAVELGVRRIRPLFTARGQVRLDGERLAKKQAHWQAVAESAAEQSGRLVCPTVDPAVDMAQLLNEPAEPGETLRLMLAPEAARSLSKIAPAMRVALLIGPESGLSHDEIERAAAANWQALTLGPRILRTETAGMAAIAALQTAWGDLAG
ncbi:16S rRNA (uracil(1498)-N(3))-methyltransferase [Salinisphaera aquimarina]|uniref:Ribosomal RNA small subunit methyltransferase E n=1 Tax=Salinisphaera aquimarina TaxID=2094031 RepID=A0ABV7EWS7_9GAMM